MQWAQAQNRKHFGHFEFTSIFFSEADVDENGTPFKKARKQHMPLTEEDKEKRRENR
jgi:hypothetical protein